MAEATDIFGSSDEDFFNTAPPSGGAIAASEEQAPVIEAPVVEEPKQDEAEIPAVVLAPDPSDEDIQAGTVEAPKVETVEPKVEEPKTEEVAPVADAPLGSKEENPNTEEAPKVEVQAPNENVDYEGFYKSIMAPIKANGKTIELKDPSEAIALMQMGANYTKKMQAIQPHRKVLLMLENNGLLDEGKLSYLIDLDKKNPEAVKKLIKDAGIDPLDIDTNIEPAYTAGNHTVSDAEANFISTLEDVQSTPEGVKFVADVNTRFDQASKNALWEDPQLLVSLNQQRELGIYDQIVTEMDRQITLGQIPATTPFLQAYRTAGDALVAAGGFKGTTEGVTTPDVPKVPEVVVPDRVITPKAPANSDKVAAAAPSQSTTRKAAPIVNPLEMSDDEFIKLGNLQNRL